MFSEGQTPSVSSGKRCIGDASVYIFLFKRLELLVFICYFSSSLGTSHVVSTLALSNMED